MTKKQTHKTSIGKLNKILNLKEKGVSLRDIALIVNMSQEGVRYLLKKYKKTGGDTND